MSNNIVENNPTKTLMSSQWSHSYLITELLLEIKSPDLRRSTNGCFTILKWFMNTKWLISVQLKLGRKEPGAKVDRKVRNEAVTAGMARVPATFWIVLENFSVVSFYFRMTSEDIFSHHGICWTLIAFWLLDAMKSIYLHLI